jgi:hypothetical protein
MCSGPRELIWIIEAEGSAPAINQIGVIQPGNSRQTGNLSTVRTCGFHDHRQPSNNAFQGSIRIQ